MKDQIKLKLAGQLLITHEQITKSSPNYKPSCFIGFDGFTDDIIDVVDTRIDLKNYVPMTQMAQFGSRIQEFAGKSCNIEFVTRKTKIGGNAPILANALLEGGHRITFVGAIGEPGSVEPLFKEMAERCEATYSLCPSGHSDALEFHDGKVILGKHDTLLGVNYTTLINQIPKNQLIDILEHCQLFVSANWTMLPLMTELWEQLYIEILPSLSGSTKEKPRFLFVDLADPAKRTDDDLNKCLSVLKTLGEKFNVILGLNQAEASRIGKVLSCEPKNDSKSGFFDLAQQIHSRSELDQIIIHATRYALGVNNIDSSIVEGPYTSKPRLTTGAGDNFNAGFCNGLLYGYSLEESLLTGVSTSGYYVRNGHSPNIEQLSDFLKDWEKGTN